jgi:hypothetical protein
MEQRRKIVKTGQVKLSDRTIFIHSVLDDASKLERLLFQLGDALAVGHSAWLCTDAEGREGFQLWRTEENFVYDAGVHAAQFGVSELARFEISDRFEKLRETLNIETKGFPEPGAGSGKYADVEFLKSTGWF